MDRQFVLSAGKFGVGELAREDGKRGNRAQEECLEMVAADHDHGVGLGFLKFAANLTHRRDVGVELLGILARRTVKKLRGVHGGICCRQSLPMSVTSFLVE